MNIGLIDVDGHNYPNFALMRASAFYKQQGHSVEWAMPRLFAHYDKVLSAKVFTFSPDYDYSDLSADEIFKGGTGYDITSHLPADIEASTLMDYSLYESCNYSVQFFSRGCIRRCPFCLVREKEGYITPVQPVQLNPRGKWIEVLDNNFFANPMWPKSIEYLVTLGQPVNLYGVDIRIMDEEQARALSRLRLKNNIHIAWDMPEIDLEQKLLQVLQYIPAHKLTCYVLVGYNSTKEQDMHRLSVLKALGIAPFVMVYRSYNNSISHDMEYAKDLARWANRREIFKTCDFKDFSPRKGFKCERYFHD